MCRNGAIGFGPLVSITEYSISLTKEGLDVCSNSGTGGIRVLDDWRAVQVHAKQHVASIGLSYHNLWARLQL
jgi:hypothetical protein